ncbi:MAG TPA: hypothetical protein VID48_08710 [Solirubrobacteraceae bacterium]
MGLVVFVLALIAVLATVPAIAAAATPPSVFDESVSGITEHDAMLEASINPNGLKTTYRFRLESGCLPPRECLVIETYPLPSGEIPASSEAHHLTLDLNGAGVTLEPYTEYRYSLEATSSGGTTEGPGHFFTTAPASAPSIGGESVSNITSTDAALEAKINPEGLETTYEVWVGALPCVEEFGGPERCEEDKVAGTIPGGFSAQTVSVDIAKASHELKPNSPYLYSFRATNMDGTTYGANKEFKTADASPPSIVSESVSHLTPTDATLEAQINTEGLETTYNFYLQEAPLCLDFGCEVPEREPVALPAGKLLGSFVGQSVSVELNSAGVTLNPGADYRYWVSATSGAGPTRGQTQRFIAPENGTAQPPNTTTPPGSQSTTGPASDAGQGTVTLGASTLVGNVTPSPKLTVLMGAQKLPKALKGCKHKPRKQRASCKKQARKQYGTIGR